MIFYVAKDLRTVTMEGLDLVCIFICWLSDWLVDWFLHSFLCGPMSSHKEKLHKFNVLIFSIFQV